jgi:hypothetical protein
MRPLALEETFTGEGDGVAKAGAGARDGAEARAGARARAVVAREYGQREELARGWKAEGRLAEGG